MLIEHVTLYEDSYSIEIEETEIEEIEAEEIGPDPRLGGLSPETRRAIEAMFDGDVDEAEFAAARLFPLYRNPPRWIAEVHGAARQGWRDFNRTHV